MLWLAILLLVLAVGLIFGEFFTGSGLLFLCGLVALVFGLVVLFNQSTLFPQINWWVIIPVIIVFVGLIVFIIFRILNTYRHKVTTGQEDLEGQIAIVKQTLDPEGTVLYQGEYWNAVSQSGRMEPGDNVVIERVSGLTLYVKKAY
jgi:membrane-bound serine protease (ClpP class)